MNIQIVVLVSILMSFPANYVMYILTVFLLIDFSFIVDIFLLLCTLVVFFFFFNVFIYLNRSCLRQEDKCLLYLFMSTKMEVPLQSELTECLVNARH